MLCVPSAIAQTYDSGASASHPKEDEVNTPIQINNAFSDEKIKSRLNNIFSVDPDLGGVNVEVSNGIVVLLGEVSNKKQQEFVSSISHRMEGVVAVKNQVQVKKQPFFSIEPMKNEIRQIGNNILRYLPILLSGFVVLFGFYFLAKPVSEWLAKPLTLVTQSELVYIVAKRILIIFFCLLGGYLFLRIAGLTQFAFAIVSGTGIIGIIVGIAFKDIAENFISSLLLSMQRPFSLGDVIEVNENIGVVHKVTTRGTVLVDYDGNHIQIPNATIYKNVITNYTANPNIRETFKIGIGYDADIKLAQKIILEVIRNEKSVLRDPEPLVLIDNAGSSTINLFVHFWVNAHQYSLVKVKSRLIHLSCNKLMAAGVSMPDDAREVIFPQGVPVNLLNDNAPMSKSYQAARDDKVADSGNRLKNNVSDLTEQEQEAEVDLSSETEDIKTQAQKARDPENGRNII